MLNSIPGCVSITLHRLLSYWWMPGLTPLPHHNFLHDLGENFTGICTQEIRSWVMGM